MKALQKVLNFGIGLVLLNNLYLLSGLTRIPHLLVIGLSLMTAVFFTLSQWNSEKAIQLLNNWYTFLCLFFSLLLFSLDYFLYESEVKVNDLIRILLYAFYFTWTYLLFDDKELLLAWIKKLAIWSIAILILQGLFEYYQPYLWTFMLSSNVEKRTVGRIAGSLIDSNSYACSMIIFYLIYFKEQVGKLNLLRGGFLLLLFLAVFYFNELSGSRQGALIIVLFLAFLFYENLSIQNLKYLLITASIGLVLILVFNQQIFDYADANPHSAIGRFLGGADNKASQSNLDRQNSIFQGIIFLSESYFIFGPGMLNFASRWANFSDAHEPHIGFLFLMVQFGVLSLVLFYIYYVSYKRSIVAKVSLVFLALFLHITLQPSTVYYAITFFVFFYVDIKFYQSKENDKLNVKDLKID